MRKYKEISDTSLLDDAYCEECGEMIIVQVNNTQLAKFEHDDWFCYCANKECEKHSGEGSFQAYPDWVIFEQTRSKLSGLGAVRRYPVPYIKRKENVDLGV